MTAVTKPNYSLREIPDVWALGFLSMLMDVSSEMIHASLPIYLVTVLATSMVMVSVMKAPCIWSWRSCTRRSLAVFLSSAW